MVRQLRTALTLGLLAAASAGCPSVKVDDSGDTGDGTCCAFVCTDGTEGTVTFTVDATDCNSYAADQCSLAGASVDDVAFETSGC